MAGSVSIEHLQVGHVRKIVATCVADAADGSFPSTVLPAFEGRVLQLVTNPGATAPTDNYDVVVTNQHGHDVLQGVGANRDTANTEVAPVVYTGTSLHPVVDETDTLTVAISNNVVNSAEVVVEIVYAVGV